VALALRPSSAPYSSSRVVSTHSGARIHLWGVYDPGSVASGASPLAIKSSDGSDPRRHSLCVLGFSQTSSSHSSLCGSLGRNLLVEVPTFLGTPGRSSQQRRAAPQTRPSKHGGAGECTGSAGLDQGRRGGLPGCDMMLVNQSLHRVFDVVVCLCRCLKPSEEHSSGRWVCGGTRTTGSLGKQQF